MTDKEMTMQEMEAIFNEDQGVPANQGARSTTADDQHKHEVDLDKIKMSSSAEFTSWDSPPKMVHIGKIDDGSPHKQQFVMVRKTSQSGKVYCEVYLKAGTLFQCKQGSKAVMSGELNYEHGMIDKTKKNTVFVYDNQSYFGYDIQDYVPYNPDEKK
jgi:hypothetical protein